MKNRRFGSPRDDRWPALKVRLSSTALSVLFDYRYGTLYHRIQATSCRTCDELAIVARRVQPDPLVCHRIWCLTMTSRPVAMISTLALVTTLLVALFGLERRPPANLSNVAGQTARYAGDKGAASESPAPILPGQRASVGLVPVQRLHALMGRKPLLPDHAMSAEEIGPVIVYTETSMSGAFGHNFPFFDGMCDWRCGEQIKCVFTGDKTMRHKAHGLLYRDEEPPDPHVPKAYPEQKKIYMCFERYSNTCPSPAFPCR